MLPLPERAAQLDALMVHELTHILVSEIILPGTGGDGGVPRWVHEGIASYMVGDWPDDHERRMRELVASGEVPALSQLTGSGGFADGRLNDTLGHVVRLHREPVGTQQHSSLSERANRPARG